MQPQDTNTNPGPSSVRPVGVTGPAGAARPVRPVVRRPVAVGGASAAPVMPAPEPVKNSGPSFDNGPSVVGKKERKTGWILAIILLLLIAAGGVGFGVWMWMDGNAQKDALNSQISSLKQQNNSLQEQLDNSNTIINIDTDDVWDSFSNGLAQKSTITEGEYWSYNGTENVHHQLTAFKDVDGNLKIVDNGNETLLETDDVIASYFIHVGNGADAYFYIIKSDGSVYRFGTPETASEIEKVGDYTKIAVVFQESNLGVVLIDIYGNTYETH